MSRFFRTSLIIIFSALLWAFFFYGGISLIRPESAESMVISKSPTSITTGLNSGLVGWWTFDGKDCGVLDCLDKSGNNNTAVTTTAAGMPVRVTGKVGAARKFDGTNDYLNVTDTTSTHPTLITLSAWVKTTDNGNYTTVLHDGDYTGPAGAFWGFALLKDNTNKMYFYVSNGAGATQGTHWQKVTAATTVNDGKWHHIVGTYNGSQIKIYQDGALSNTVNFSITVGWRATGSNFLSLGMWRTTNGPDQYYWKGPLDDVRIYNRVLSLAEIQQLYKQGGGKISKSPTGITTGLNTGLVGWWTFDGNTCGALDCLDKSGNNNTAVTTTAAGMPRKNIGKIGQAMKFDGVDDYLDAGDIAILDGASKFTISFWGKRNSATAYLPVGKRNNLYTTAVNIWNDGNIYFNVTNGSASYGLLSFNNTNWHLYTMVFDGTQADNPGRLKGYIDATQQSLAFTGTIPVTTADLGSFEIGRSDLVTSKLYGQGLIDDVRVYSRALSTAEIQQLYKQGGGKISKSPTGITTGLNTGLVGWWTFDGADVNATRVLDKSGKGYNATRAGSAYPVVGKIGQGFGKGFASSTNNYLVVADNDDVEPPTGNFTVSTWMKVAKTQPAGFGYLVTTGAGGGGLGWGFSQNGGVGSNLNFEIFASGGTRVIGTFGNSASVYGSWHHFLATVDRAGSMKIYLDGVLKDTDDVSADVGRSIANTNGVYFNGLAYRSDFLVDDTRIYSRVLSTAEIQQLYKMGK